MCDIRLDRCTVQASPGWVLQRVGLRCRCKEALEVVDIFGFELSGSWFILLV